MGVELYNYQKESIKRMKNGCILCGSVGSGKSITGLAYYFKENGGTLGKDYGAMKDPKDLYIITTARKRDKCEWDFELAQFLLSRNSDTNLYSNKVIVDSWNNIKKYVDVKDAFFIFDEQRVVGWGAWSKTFVKIAKSNKWILLSATPGDTWMDYIPVFVANGFYRNKTQFVREHVIFNHHVKNYPKVEGYHNTGRLVRLRNSILVNMDYHKSTVSHHNDIYTEWDIQRYKDTIRNKWNYHKEEPLNGASDLCYELRHIVNEHPSRLTQVMDIVKERKKVIIFYNFDYELELLKTMFQLVDYISVAEWNGHKHQEIPDSEWWVYLVQYTAGCEGWNCVKTDTIIFYSQNYSYKVMVQAAGRIDRLNTPFTDLYYYHMKSRSGIDLAISKALKSKKKFNERSFQESIFKGK